MPATWRVSGNRNNPEKKPGIRLASIGNSAFMHTLDKDIDPHENHLIP